MDSAYDERQPLLVEQLWDSFFKDGIAENEKQNREKRVSGEENIRPIVHLI